jgi:hypothetical protein
MKMALFCPLLAKKTPNLDYFIHFLNLLRYLIK